MRLKTSSLFAAAAATALMASSAHAATITYDFTGNSAAVSSNGLAGDGVTADAAVTGGLMEVDENRAQRKLLDSGAGTLAITLNIGSTPVDLTGLSFIDGIDSGQGTNDTFSQWDITVSNGGSASPSTVTNSLTTGSTGSTSKANNLTLSGLNNLSNTSVSFEFLANYGITSDFSAGGNNNNRHAFIDDIVFTGSVVPEPGSLALLGLGGLLIGARRRRG